jgi:P27 family predicted phage terminase small subunit
MPPGPKPQSAAEREQKESIRSVHRKRSAAPDAPVAAGGVQPPLWLKKEGLRIWNRLAPPLRMQKLLTQADAETFARYCRNFARWLKMQKDIDKEGEAYESESQWGKLKRVNPSFLIADRLERQLLATEDRFGLNPAERQRIFAARAATGLPSDLFNAQQQPSERREDDAAAQPTEPAEPEQGPVGFLN